MTNYNLRRVMNPTVQEPFCPPRPKLPEANILESSYLIDLTRMTNQQVRSMPLKNMTILAAAPSNTACFFAEVLLNQLLTYLLPLYLVVQFHEIFVSKILQYLLSEIFCFFP